MRSRTTIILALIAMCFLFWGNAPANAYQTSPNAAIQTGYVVITATSGDPHNLVAFETFGERRRSQTAQAGVLQGEMSRSAMIFVATSQRLSRNLGVAIANPGHQDARVTLTLRNDGGIQQATKTLLVRARSQTAQFVTQMFSDPPGLPADFTGTLSFSSDTPVAVVGLRFRGENFSTIPITRLGTLEPVPQISNGVGGSSAIILPHYSLGGGWVSQIVLANAGSSPLVVRVDFFDQNGQPAAVELNRISASTFPALTVPAGGVFILAPRDNSGDDDF